MADVFMFDKVNKLNARNNAMVFGPNVNQNTKKHMSKCHVASVDIPDKWHNKIRICFHPNASLGLCQCEKEDWRFIKKGSWSSVMSPFEQKFVDVKFVGGVSGSVTVTLDGRQCHGDGAWCRIFSGSLSLRICQFNPCKFWTQSRVAEPGFGIYAACHHSIRSGSWLLAGAHLCYIRRWGCGHWHNPIYQMGHACYCSHMYLSELGQPKEEKSFQDGRKREIEPVEEQNDGLDKVSKEKSMDLNETTKVETQEDTIPFRSSEKESDLEKAKAENSQNTILPIHDLESVSEVHIPEVVSISEDSNLKEDWLTSATETYVDEEKESVTKVISSDEKTEQIREIGENNSLYIKDDVTQENQLNSTEDCKETSKDVILTEENQQVPLKIQKERKQMTSKKRLLKKIVVPQSLRKNEQKMANVISYSDPIHVGISEVRADEISSAEKATKL